MTVHHLKCEPQYFAEVLAGRKPFEVRYDDRNYNIGDTLVLMEYSVSEGATGREVRRLVSYLLRDFEGLRRNWVAMGLAVSLPASSVETAVVCGEQTVFGHCTLPKGHECGHDAIRHDGAGPDCGCEKCDAMWPAGEQR